jgi:hypothetical protein
MATFVFAPALGRCLHGNLHNEKIGRQAHGLAGKLDGSLQTNW